MAEIDLAALEINLKQVQSQIGSAKILAVVKANAYGHGGATVARFLESRGVAFFGVAHFEEAILLREAGVRLPILVLTGIRPDQVAEAVRFNLTPVLFNRELLQALRQYTERSQTMVSVHLKIDTGMGRLGVSPKEALSWIQEVASCPGIRVEGILSHFSDADLQDLSFAQSQIAGMASLWRSLKHSGVHIDYCHLANSAATIQLPLAHFNLVRPGLMLYGYSPLSEGPTVPLRPVMRWRTRVISIKRVPSQTPISYGRTFVTQRESLIATLSIGYADGYPRALSNRGVVLASGRRVPVVGRVCMDMTMVDLTEVPTLSVGDWVTLMGSEGTAAVWADELARLTGTIPYEILCRISDRVPRVYLNETAPPTLKDPSE